MTPELQELIDKVSEHTGQMPWDDIWDFGHYKVSGVRRRVITLFDKSDCDNCKASLLNKAALDRKEGGK